MGNLVISPWQLVVDKHRLDGGGFGADRAGGSWELWSWYMIGINGNMAWFTYMNGGFLWQNSI